MRIRRYTLHALSEILLITVGILVAVQLNNCNDDRKQQNLQASYLERLAEELEADTAYFGSQARLNREAIATVEAFARALRDDSVTDDGLVAATRQFMTIGWVIPKYEPVVTTFEDLSVTGNLGVIRDPVLREQIVFVYGEFERYRAINQGNRDWTNYYDARFAFEFDAFRWDARTAHLFSAVDPRREAAAIRRDSASYLRTASIHYWIIDRVLELYDASIDQSVQALTAIRERQAR